MSIVAFRDGVLASDSLASFDNGEVPFTLPSAKIHELGKGLVGLTGSLSSQEVMLHALGMHGGNLPDEVAEEAKRTEMLVLASDLTIWMYIGSHRGIKLDNSPPYLAIGAASPIALGAMHVGATAIEAVMACVVHHNTCALPIFTGQFDGVDGAPNIVMI